MAHRMTLVFRFPLLQKFNNAVRLSSKKLQLTIDLSHGFRFGNRLFDLASLYGIADTLGRQPVYYVQDWQFRDLVSFTSKIMPGLFDQLLLINSTVLLTNNGMFQLLAFPATRYKSTSLVPRTLLFIRRSKQLKTHQRSSFASFRAIFHELQVFPSSAT